MHKQVTFQAAFLSSLLALACILIMAFVIQPPEPGAIIQPSVPPVPSEEFVRTTNAFPEVAVQFFAVDSLFILSYLMVFLGLHAVAIDRSSSFAWLGLGAGILAALLDAVENTYFINYALLSLRGESIVEPAVPLIFNIANLKWMAAFTTLYAFGLVWPRDGWLDWFIVIIMLLFPIFGILGVAIPALIPYRGVFFLIGMPLFAIYFWKQIHK